MKFQPQKFFALALLSSFMLVACGQRGPLYHPVKPAAVPAPESNKQDKQKTNQ